MSLLPHQFLRTPSSFAFRVVSGPLIYTAMSVINALRQPPRGSGPVPTVSPLYTIPDLRYQVHSVLQFVPTHTDIRVCNFSERVERGLMMAYSETRRRSNEAGNITVQVSLLPELLPILPISISYKSEKSTKPLDWRSLNQQLTDYCYGHFLRFEGLSYCVMFDWLPGYAAA